MIGVLLLIPTSKIFYRRKAITFSRLKRFIWIHISSCEMRSPSLNFDSVYPRWIIFGGERNAENTHVQPGRAFLSRYVGQISHTFACTLAPARRGGWRLAWESEKLVHANFSIDRQPSGPARLREARGESRCPRVSIPIPCPRPQRRRATLRCSRCADKALIAVPRYAAPLDSRKDRAQRIKTARRRCRAPVDAEDTRYQSRWHKSRGAFRLLG